MIRFITHDPFSFNSMSFAFSSTLAQPHRPSHHQTQHFSGKLVSAGLPGTQEQPSMGCSLLPLHAVKWPRAGLCRVHPPFAAPAAWLHTEPALIHDDLFALPLPDQKQEVQAGGISADLYEISLPAYAYSSALTFGTSEVRAA